ncbi:divergent polysaccharide deacetylase family protein [Kordiimonas aestuarii]|uniref:divergent polysaccharide deacetylase family protein n=1 Tax=Kordiimonas aestuarii TaxID=1005925 RepID=UPI0021D07762|nr:divergent polysaccharide deacetylase family protein [Kordiimonas aestuarii]
MFGQKKLNSKRQTTKKPSRWQRFKRAAIYLYVGVVLASITALVLVLDDEKDMLRDEGNAEIDADVVAILEAMDGEKSEAPIGEIDDFLPIRKQKPAKVEPEPVEPAWRLYAANWPLVRQPMLAIVIDDLGLSEDATTLLAEMQGPYTLSYLPYAENLATQTALVRNAGHELMVHMPMQPQNADADPGPNAMLNDLTPAEFDRRLEWNLSRFEGYVGVNNHMGSALTENAGAMVRVMVRLKRDGHLFLDSLTSPKSVGVRAAKATGVPYIARDIFLDNVRQEGLILEQLAKAERIARSRGYAIAICHPYDVTLGTLMKWRKTLDKKGISLVPLSQIVASREAVRHARLVNAQEKDD